VDQEYLLKLARVDRELKAFRLRLLGVMFDLGEEEDERLYFIPLDEEASNENMEEWEKHLMIEKMFPVDREFIHISDDFVSEEERAALSKQLGYVRDQAVQLYRSAKSICSGAIKKSSKYELYNAYGNRFYSLEQEARAIISKYRERGKEYTR
jgi:hypothetical protein